MTDETTTRDRAIEGPARRIAREVRALISDRPGQLDELEQIADELRALAGAPTADAAATEWGAKWSDGGYCPSSPPRSEEFARQHARNFGTRPIRRSVGPWLYDDTGEFVFADERVQFAAAPEGVDAADELSALVEPDYIQDGVQGWLVGGGLDVERDATGSGDPTIQIGGVEHPPRRVRALRDALIAALDDAPDGMDAEAQGEMADQLAAAQAAIQRVRDLAGRWERGTNVGILRHVAVVGLRRALDGDTTEEA